MVDGFVGRIQAANAAITSAFRTMAIPVGIAVGLGAMVKATADAVEENLNLANKLETTYAQMMALRVGAQNAGGSIEGMTKAMESFQEKLGKGDAGAIGALKELGINVKDVLGKGAYQQISLISAAFEKVGSSEKKAALGAELFGKASRELNVFLSEGSTELAKNLEYVERTGLAMTETSAIKMKVLGDSFDAFMDSMKGLWQQLVLLFAEPATMFINGLSEMAQGAVLLVKLFQDIAHGIKRATLELTNFVTLGMSSNVAEALGNMRGLDASGNQPGQKTLAAMEAKRRDDIKRLADRPVDFSTHPWLTADEQNAKDDAYAAKRDDDRARNANGQFLTNDLGKLFQTAIEALVPKISNWMEAALAEKAKQTTLDRLGSAFSPAEELGLSGFYDKMKANSPIDAASGGTRGTFASDNAGRSVGSFSIEKAQLDTLKSIDQHLEAIAEDGVVANAG